MISSRARRKPQSMRESGPGGVDPARFTRRPLAQTDRFAFWRRWLVDEPRGWDMSGRPGSVVYDEQDLAPFQSGAPVLLYVGRFTAVKRPT